MQALLDLYEAPRYLEIGVQTGKCFRAVRAARKVGVDPTFQFDWEAYEAETKGCSLPPLRSDTFFGEVAGIDDVFDVIFLDGFHTAEQTLRDFNSAVMHLTPKGIVVIDDVVPTSYAASLPDPAAAARVREAAGEAGNSWMGDVYRLVFFIDSFHQAFSYRTVTDHHGQLIAWRASRPAAEVTPRAIADIGRLSYADSLAEDAPYRRATFAETLDLLRAYVQEED